MKRAAVGRVAFQLEDYVVEDSIDAEAEAAVGPDYGRRSLLEHIRDDSDEALASLLPLCDRLLVALELDLEIVASVVLPFAVDVPLNCADALLGFLYPSVVNEGPPAIVDAPVFVGVLLVFDGLPLPRRHRPVHGVGVVRCLALDDRRRFGKVERCLADLVDDPRLGSGCHRLDDEPQLVLQDLPGPLVEASLEDVAVRLDARDLLGFVE